jgi:hypothetical protein
LLGEWGIEEAVIASDSTGLAPSQASAYDQTRRGRSFREFIKGAYAVGTHTQFILAARAGRGPGNDAPYLTGLRRNARRYGRYVGKRRAWVMLADAGFDSQSVQDGDLIPPGNLVDPDRQARAGLVAATRRDGLFGQRWTTETVNSVIKRQFGDAIRSPQRSLQNRELVIKGLVYDIHV